MKSKLTLKSILRWAIYTNLTAVFFFSFGLAGRYPYNYVNIALWLVLGVLYFVMRRVEHIKTFKFRYDVFAIAMAVYCLTMILSFLLSGCVNFSKVGIVCALSGLMIYWILSDGIVSRKAMLICACVGAVGLLATFGFIYRSNIIHPNFSKRIGGYFDNQNEIALNLALCMILLFSFGLETKEWYLRAGGIFFSLIAFYFVVLTGSVSTVLAITIVFFVSIPFFFKKHRWVVFLIEAALVALGVIVIFNVPAFSYYAKRISGMLSSLGLESGSGDSSFESRYYSIVVGLRVFLENPLFGAGNEAVYRNYNITAHNNFAQVLASYGIFTFIAHEGVILLPLFKTRKSKEPYRKLVLPLSLFMFLFQFFLFTFDSKPGSILIAVCFYLMFPEGCYTKELKRASIRNTRIEI